MLNWLSHKRYNFVDMLSCSWIVAAVSHDKWAFAITILFVGAAISGVITACSKS